VQLRQTQHAVRTHLDADLAETGLTTPQYAALAVLDREGKLSASALAREFGMSAQTMNVLVRGLVAQGLLRRVQHPSHGRILLASLTGAGRRALDRGRRLALVTEDRMLSGVSVADRNALMRALTAIERTLS
jgi:DNA-binding MarR family transcriptional regulator